MCSEIDLVQTGGSVSVSLSWRVPWWKWLSKVATRLLSSATMTRKPTSKTSRKPLKTLKLTPHDSDDALEPPAKKYRAGFMVRPRKDVIYPTSNTLTVLVQLSNPPVIDLTKEDTLPSSSSPASASSSRLAMPIHPSQQPSVDVKGKHNETRTSIDDGDDSMWVDKYEPTSEVRRVPSSCS